MIKSEVADRMAALRAVERRALVALLAAPDGLPADLVGAKVWPERVGRVTAVQGGGDYAAQMLLGRMRKQGLVETAPRFHAGTSIWQLTHQGRIEAKKI